MKLKWINKTPHTIRRIGVHGEVIEEMHPSDFPIRVRQPERLVYTADGTVVKRYIGSPVFKGLPEPIRKDSVYVVSMIVASLIKQWNFVAPNANPASVKRRGSTTFGVRTFITFGEMPSDGNQRPDRSIVTSGDY